MEEKKRLTKKDKSKIKAQIDEETVQVSGRAFGEPSVEFD